MEKIILGAIEKHSEDNVLICYSQHGFTREKLYVTNLISFYVKATHLNDQPGDVIILDFSKVFDKKKMSSMQLGKNITLLVHNWIMSQTHSALSC